MGPAPLESTVGTSSPPTQSNARALLKRHATMGMVHRRGQQWVHDRYLPAVKKLAASARPSDVKLAAKAWSIIGDLLDLNGTPRAALSAYRKVLRLAPRTAAPWHAIGCMLDNMGEWQRARHALLRATMLAPDDPMLAGDLERVEWAHFNPCPVLYEPRNVLWHAMEALAAGHYDKALSLLHRRRKIRARQIRARIYAVRGDDEAVLREWRAIGDLPGKLQLQHADWFYTLRSHAADDPALWQLMLWKIRTKIDGGAFHYSPTLAELDLSDTKRFELYVRFELARCERNIGALVAMAGKYPGWREPGEVAMRLDSKSRGVTRIGKRR
jgi:tetratricopeptide (TPR) repeat protein